MSIASEVEAYVEEMKSINAECMRPNKDGSPCKQCYERERVIGRLNAILAAPTKEGE